VLVSFQVRSIAPNQTKNQPNPTTRSYSSHSRPDQTRERPLGVTTSQLPHITNARTFHRRLPDHQYQSRLVVGDGARGELEDDTAAGQPAVDLGVGVQAVVDTAALLLVQDDLEDLAAVLLGADALADDLDRVDDVGQDGVVHGGQGARARTLLLLVVAGADGALGTGQDAARGDDQDMAVGELLLELTGQAGLEREMSAFSFPTATDPVGGYGCHTAAGSCGSPGGEGRGRRWRWPSCRGRPRSI